MHPSVSKMLETYFPDRHAQGGHLGDPDDRYIREEFRRQGMAKIQARLLEPRHHADGARR